ncbi:MAG: hypothetical protein LBJ94_02530 [Puniceicoccales bacterium]|jgi:hypothetical protein|nr:hypothetical protein [Puniceicoccales bacterium]
MSNFQQHLKRIALAKRRAEEILNVWSPAEDATIASVAFAWERIFDTLCNDDDISIADLNTITGVMQKLSALKAERCSAGPKLSPGDIITQAEEQLKLL